MSSGRRLWLAGLAVASFQCLAGPAQAEAGLPQDPSVLRALQFESTDERTAFLVETLQGTSAEDLAGVLQVVFEEFIDSTRRYEIEQARALAEAMFARAPAGWSAMSLALICTRAGESSRALEVLRTQVAGTPEGPAQYELLERLGLAIQGSGHEAAALGPLGSAFARGSANAGVVLGRIALREGQLEQARSIFRTLLTQEPPQSWAMRGWGLSMLPPRPPNVARTK